MDIDPINSFVRFFDEKDAQYYLALIKRNRSIASTKTARDFYFQRAIDIANNTVIVVRRTGRVENIQIEGEKTADVIEKLVFLSSTLVMSRKDIHRRLGIRPHPSSSMNLTMDSKIRVKTRSKSELSSKGVIIDKRFCRRFERCGFPQLASLCVSNTDIAKRTMSTINWIFESRLEPLLEASVVKTSIALESLLISNESEPLSKTLSERAAFILSSDPDARRNISKVVKNFYNVRSGIVHGSESKRKKLTPSLVEGMDRLVVLLCLIISSNTNMWASVKSLVTWCEDQRWIEPSDIQIPFPNIYLNNALHLCK